MTECQGCGAWNDARRTLCVLCGTPLAETDEWEATADLPPLPPLPDGGLGVTMPAWLRAAPEAPAAPETLAPGPLPQPGAGPPAPGPAAHQPSPPALLSPLPPLGPQADPRTFLTDDDFPRWLRDLAVRRPSLSPGPTSPQPPWAAWPAAGAPPLAASPREASRLAAPPPAVNPAVTTATEPPPAQVAARVLDERRPRSPWETLLLVILFIGVVVAALWALASNGVFSPSL